MIGWLSGEVIRLFPGGVILNVNGVGYKIFTPSFSWKVGERCEVYIHHHIREDQSNLFGFATPEELDFFELLLTVPGVGPKLAQTILSKSTVSGVRQAIEQGQPAILQAIPGVGAKVAAKIVVELKSKITGGALDMANWDGQNEVVDALVSLGIPRTNIIETLKDLPGDVTSVDQQIKWVLKRVGKQFDRNTVG